MLIESSERLMALLGGQCEARPPYWEPWFVMPQMLKARYHNSYMEMASDLGHAAIPLLGVDTKVTFLAEVERTEAGAYYGGGALREPQQLWDQAEPDYEADLEKMLIQREQCAKAGLACWMVIGWCFDRIATSMGLENFALECYDRPQFIHDAMHWVEERNQRSIEKVIRKVKPDFVLYNGDCAYKTGTMIAPSMMRDFCFEPTLKTVKMIQDLGIPFAFHSDGKLDEVIPMLIELGICAVHGCEKQANDLAHLVETFGDDIVLCGNMDVVFLKNATVDQVREQTLQMLEIGAGKKRFIAGCNTSPQDYLPYENYATFVKTVAGYQG